MPFLDILSEWDVLEADMHHFYGVDLSDPVVQSRPWRWFTVRVKWLMNRADSGLRAVFRPPEETGDNTPHGNA